MPSKGVADLDFMEYRRVILKSDQVPSIVASVTLSRRRGRTCCSICARTCEDPQRLPGVTIWNHVGVSKSVVGLAG